MANFNTHVSVASGMSLAASSALLGSNIVSPKHVLACFSLGIIGGILPDVDSDHSTTVRFMFSMLAIVLTFSVLFGFADHYSILELLVVSMVVFLLVRYGACHVFMKWTVHRGIFHSIPAAFLFSLLTVLLALYIFQVDDVPAWLCGSFVLIGYLTHLSLDEMYSVDFSNSVLKESFGTALKFFNPREARAYLVLYAAIVALLIAIPGPQSTVDKLNEVWARNSVEHRLFPSEGWFKDVQKLVRDAVGDGGPG